MCISVVALWPDSSRHCSMSLSLYFCFSWFVLLCCFVVVVVYYNSPRSSFLPIVTIWVLSASLQSGHQRSTARGGRLSPLKRLSLLLLSPRLLLLFIFVLFVVLHPPPFAPLFLFLFFFYFLLFRFRGCVCLPPCAVCSHSSCLTSCF